jgi:hypothetical protein
MDTMRWGNGVHQFAADWPCGCGTQPRRAITAKSSSFPNIRGFFDGITHARLCAALAAALARERRESWHGFNWLHIDSAP